MSSFFVVITVTYAKQLVLLCGVILFGMFATRCAVTITGIVFLDEVDKISSLPGYRMRDVGGEGVQQVNPS